MSSSVLRVVTGVSFAAMLLGCGDREALKQAEKERASAEARAATAERTLAERVASEQGSDNQPPPGDVPEGAAKAEGPKDTAPDAGGHASSPAAAEPKRATPAEASGKPAVKRYTGIFQALDPARGQRATTLRAGNTEYLLKLLVADPPERADKGLADQVRVGAIMAKINSHNRLMSLAQVGDQTGMTLEIEALSRVQSLLEDEGAIEDVALHLQIASRLGLEGGTDCVIEGFTVRDPSHYEDRWLVAISIDGRRLCSEEEARPWCAENEEFLAWARFTPGVAVKYHTQGSGETEMETWQAKTLARVDSEAAVVQIVETARVQGKDGESKTTTARIPRWVLAPRRSLPAADSVVETGDQQIAQMGVHWVKSRASKETEEGNRETEVTVWTSDAIPGRIVRRVASDRWTERSVGKRVDMVTELVDVTGPSMEAVGEAWRGHLVQEAEPRMRKLAEAIDAGDKLTAFGLAEELQLSLGEAASLKALRERVEALPWPGRVSFPLGEGQGVTLVWIPPGSFEMGSATGRDNERPVRKVTFTVGFYLGETEVTEAQWKALDGHYVRGWKDHRQVVDPAQPVDGLYVRAIEEWMDKLGKAAGWRGCFRLPGEAEWEYACRAGAKTDYGFGDEPEGLGEHAWFKGNAGGDSHPVRGRKPNAWGLFDMHGNALEWCGQAYVESCPAGAIVDPAVHGTADLDLGGNRKAVVRGGSWRDDAQACRSAYRSGLTAGRMSGDPDVGFRIVFQPQRPLR